MNQPATCQTDEHLGKVVRFFLERNGFEQQAAERLRTAIDEVIDGMRTGRWSIDSLVKTEKTYIGSKVEILFKFDFELSDGNKLDTRIEGTEVDIKCTVLKDWMIPQEAIGELCLLVRIDDRKSKFWIGLVRATSTVLRKSKNRDSKYSLSAEGKRSICWLIEEGSLPENLLATLAPTVRGSILSLKSGQARVRELFRLVQGRIISRTAIETAAKQKDPMKRARDARKSLLKDGILVLGHQRRDRTIAIKMGLPVPRNGEMISIAIPDSSPEQTSA